MVRISERDREILRLLGKNARMSYTELARELGVTEGAVRKRVKKLEREGVIKGYTVLVDPGKTGCRVALVGFDAAPERLIGVINEAKGWKGVKRILLTAGDHSAILEFWYKSPEELMSFVSRLESMEGVSRVCPAVIVEEIVL